MRPKILVIEEDPDLSRLFAEILRVEGYAVTMVQSINEAHQQLAQNEPDLLIYDWSITNATGYLWLDQIRNSADYRHIPALLVSDTTPPRGVVEMLGNLGVPLVEKPFDLIVFCRYVAGLLAPHERSVGTAW